MSRDTNTLFWLDTIKQVTSPLEEDVSKLDKSLLDKINKMYNLPSESAPSENSSDLIATLPLDFPKSVLLKNILSRD